MYIVKKTMDIAAAHKLRFSVSGTEEPLHGHNWRVTLWCRSRKLDSDGRVPGTTEIDSQIFSRLDHGDLNELLPCSPTTENLASWICSSIESCYKVEVQECDGNIAIYERPRNE